MATEQQIADAIERLIVREGGFVNDPVDPGGATNLGITAATLGAWRRLGRKATPEEVRGLQRPEARAIYRARYVEPLAPDLIRDPGLLEVLVDSAALFGLDDPTRWLQQSLGVAADGVMGPQTRKALAATDRATQAAIAPLIVEDRKAYHRLVVSRYPARTKFLTGWLDRAVILGATAKTLSVNASREELEATEAARTPVPSPVSAPQASMPTSPSKGRTMAGKMSKTQAMLSGGGLTIVLLWVWNQLLTSLLGQAAGITLPPMTDQDAVGLTLFIVALADRVLGPIPASDNAAPAEKKAV